MVRELPETDDADAVVQETATASTTIAAVADRTFAKFTFFKLDPAWQRRDPEARAEDKREFLAACEAQDGDTAERVVHESLRWAVDRTAASLPSEADAE